MQKVGIVTYYSIYNYGSVMQAYALSETIKSLGYQPVLIDHANLKKPWNKRIRVRVLFSRLSQLIFHPSLLQSTIKIKKTGKTDIVIRSLSQDKKFDAFLAEYFDYPESDYTKDKDYIAFVAGSDQVWQFSLPGLHYLFFLRFCEKSKRISYAASFGATTVPKYNEKILREYLDGFASISVRENVGIEIVQNNSSNIATQVLDPVLLVEKSFWKQFSTGIITPSQYLIAYFLSNPASYVDSIREYAKANGLKVIWISTGHETPIENEDVIEPSPREFLDYIDMSNFVCTDSLHGTEFAIVFHKQFITFPRKYKIVPEQHSRITSLLRMTKLESRLFDDNNANWDNTIDYDYSESVLEELRGKSIDFLSNSLLMAMNGET